jgi:hypothetical protein
MKTTKSKAKSPGVDRASARVLSAQDPGSAKSRLRLLPPL